MSSSVRDQHECHRNALHENEGSRGRKNDLALEEVARLAADVFNTPAAAIALDTRHGLDFPANTGEEMDEAPSLCAAVIESKTPLLLADMDGEDRSQTAPAAGGKPPLRFYAGVPLLTASGQCVGVLCLGDHAPRRDFSKACMARLTLLASFAVDRLELRDIRHRGTDVHEAKSTFLASMSHELRTPLNGVLGMAELLLMANDVPAKHRRRIEIIQRSGETLLGLLNQLLDIAQIEAGRISLFKSPFELQPLLLELQANFKTEAQKKGLWFDVKGPEGNPAQLLGDPARLKQILTHLLSNAIKFTKEGGITLRASIQRGALNQAKVRLKVKDTGVGLDAKAIDRIFVMFEQGDRQTWRQFGGTGLGLAVCKKLAREMGGDIGVQSEPGRGATFWLALDLDINIDQPSEAKTEQMTTSPDHVQNEAAGGDRNGETILIVEDNAEMALIIQEMLNDAGYETVIAEDGGAALSSLEAHEFSLILMDGNLPDMTGFDATRQIRQQQDERAAIPIIALTGEAMLGDRERYLAAGMNDYVAKPVDFDALTATIERCLTAPATTSQAVTMP